MFFITITTYNYLNTIKYNNINWHDKLKMHPKRGTLSVKFQQNNYQRNYKPLERAIKMLQNGAFHQVSKFLVFYGRFYHKVTNPSRSVSLKFTIWYAPWHLVHTVTTYRLNLLPICFPTGNRLFQFILFYCKIENPLLWGKHNCQNRKQWFCFYYLYFLIF